MTVVLLRGRASRRRQFYWNRERPPQRRLAKKNNATFYATSRPPEGCRFLFKISGNDVKIVSKQYIHTHYSRHDMKLYFNTRIAYRVDSIELTQICHNIIRVAATAGSNLSCINRIGSPIYYAKNEIITNFVMIIITTISVCEGQAQVQYFRMFVFSTFKRM